ncbi:MAG: hypothetical protein KatS3mg102_0121 [Planctomycetota bacterium]|nr:MAG: hypothetical protein KatS3mg102_0121 [Planctomycetota bacterium]
MGTLVCRVELDKNKGITLTVENADGKITQTVQMDGTAIITTVKGDQQTSTITQKQDSIAIQCKEFTLEAETITCKSSKDTLQQAQGKYTVESSQDLSLDSKAKLLAKAAQDMGLEGLKIELKARTDAIIDALNFSGKSRLKGEIDCTQLKLNGKGQAELAGAQVRVAGQAQTAVEGGLTQVKGGMVQLQGMLKLG